MHEHDPDLIMALAEGSLDEAATSAARAEIDRCAECRDDLELQRLALSSLRELPAAYLTATESSRLHDNLKRQLHLTETAAASRRSAFAWGRWLPLTAAAGVLLLVAVSLPALLGGSEDADTVALNDAASVTTAAATEEARAPLAEGEAADDMMQSLEGAADSAAMSTTTQMEMADAGAAMAEEDIAAFGSLSFLGAIELLDRDELIAELAGEGDVFRSGSDEARLGDPAIDACLEANAAPETALLLGIPAGGEPVVVGVVADDTVSDYLLVAYVTEDIDQTVFVTMLRASCEAATVLSE